MVALHSAAAAAALIAPRLLGSIVDDVAAGTSVHSVDRLALGIVLAVLAQGLLTRFANNSGRRFAERAIARLREEFVDRTIGLPVGVVERAGTGDLATRSSVDVNNVGAAVRDVLPLMVVSGVHLALLFGALFLLSPVLGVICLVGVPPIYASARWYLRRASPAYLAEGAATAELTDTLAATAEGARTVEALRLRDERIRHGTERIGRMWTTRRYTLRLRSVLFPIVEASYALPIGAVLLAGGPLVAHRVVSLGDVVAAALYLQQAIDPIDRMLQFMEQLQRGIASYARVLGVSQVPPEASGGSDPDGTRIEVRGARFAYTGGRDVLHGIDLDVSPGERLAVVGPSGAGKSTLARLLAGLDRPGDGSVRLGGVAITEIDPEQRRRRIALITQEHHVFMGSLRDNLAFAAPEATDADMLSALTTVGADWYAELPDGLDTELGETALHLGAADAQQLALARLILADPHTLILDEATSALDPTTARRTERALAAVLGGRTVIAIAHRLNTAHDADRVAVVEDGRIVELGSHDELLRTGGAYSALWRSWHGEPVH
jgi:ATP-binding cassette subfamily C protein